MASMPVSRSSSLIYKRAEATDMMEQRKMSKEYARDSWEKWQADKAATLMAAD